MTAEVRNQVNSKRNWQHEREGSHKQSYITLKHTLIADRLLVLTRSSVPVGKNGSTSVKEATNRRGRP